MRYKAKLIVKKYFQVVKVDFKEIFVLIGKFTTIQCMLVIRVAMELEIHQMDVKITFLNVELEEDIYMEQSKEFVQKGKKYLVCKLKKSLYRLKQSLRTWYQKINLFFTNEGFCRSQVDHSLYIKQLSESLLMVIIYIDDLIILASNLSALKYMKMKLEDEFKMSDLRNLYYCLGIEFERNRTGHTITINQSKYIEEVLKQFNMEEFKLIGTPLYMNSKLLKLMEEEFKEIEREI